jgi:hypothetical protein
MTDANQHLPYLLIYPGIVVRAWHEFDKIHIVWKETVMAGEKRCGRAAWLVNAREGRDIVAR